MLRGEVEQRYHLERRLQPQRRRLQTLLRNFLAAQLDDGLKGQIVLVRAPTGFGKTEAIASCHDRQVSLGNRPVWLTLASDTDGARLESELGYAFGRPDASLSEVLQEVADGSAERTLLLDGIERLAPSSGVGLINRILREAPDNLRLVLAGRTMPQLALSRYRVQGLLTEIGPKDLALSRGETQLILGRSLPQADFEALHSTLRGWPGMVALARMALGEDPGERTLDAVVDGSHRLLRDYVLEEILPDVPPAGREVIAALAGFGVLPGSLVAQMADRMADHDFIRELEVLEPLIFKGEDRYDGYRVHPVIERVVLGVADEQDDQRRARDQRAARVFSSYGMLDRAVLHSARGEDFDYALAIFEGAGGVTLFSRMGYAMLHKVVLLFPLEMVSSVPSLRLARALVLGKQGRVVEAREVLDALVADIRTTPELTDRIGPFAMFCINAMISHYQDKGMDADELADVRRMMDACNPDDSDRMGWFHTLLVLNLLPKDNLADAEEHALRALALYQDSHNSFAQANILLHLCVIHLRSNRIEAAKAYAVRADQLVQSRQWSEANLLALVHVAMAEIQYRQGHSADARARLEAALPIIDGGEAWVDILAMGHTTLARAQWATGAKDEARETIESGRLQARRRNIPRLGESMDLLEIEFAISERDFEMAEGLAASLRANSGGTVYEAYPALRIERDIVFARLNLRSGRHDKAMDGLEELARRLEAVGPTRYLIPVRLLLVEALWKAGRADDAASVLHEAAVLSLPGGQVQSFLDEGQSLATSVNGLLRRLGLGRMTRQTAEYLGLTMGGRRRIQRDVRFMLTLREEQILSALAAGHSNKGIARQLSITEPTVKYHLKNLFAKLGVSRRTLAVSVARTIGLLGTTEPTKLAPQSPRGR